MATTAKIAKEEKMQAEIDRRRPLAARSVSSPSACVTAASIVDVRAGFCAICSVPDLFPQVRAAGEIPGVTKASW